MKLSQKDTILIKNLFLSKRYGGRTLLSESVDKGWKLESIDRLHRESARRVQLSGNMHATVDRVQHISGGPRVQSEAPAKKASISSRDFGGPRFCMKMPFSIQVCTGLFTVIWSRAQMLQTTSYSAVSQSRLPFHALINNLIVCNTSCYCSILNRKLSNK